MSSSPHIRCGDNTGGSCWTFDRAAAHPPGGNDLRAPLPLLAAVSIAAAGLAEALWNKLTGRYQTVEDLSAAVTGLLLALTPATVPVDGGGGCGVCRHCSEGCLRWPGQNIFNPALAAAPCCCCCFPRP
ncbi:MAG: RnfABCDGE type electron transport complex subunit D [Dysosmobacter welbionis]